MTILIGFQQSAYRNFEAYYCKQVQTDWRSALATLTSYNRFVELIPERLIPLCSYRSSCFGTCSGISFIDSSSLKVCHNRRIGQHKVFKDLAARGKTSVDWFYGFKLHVVVNDPGELLNFVLTPGNQDDRTPVPKLLQQLFGKVFAGKRFVRKQWGTAQYPSTAKHEESADTFGRSPVAAKARHH